MIANVGHLRIPQPDRLSPLSIRRIRKRETPLASMLPDVSHLLFTKQLQILVIGLDSSRVTGTSLQRKKLPMVVSDPLSVMMLCGRVM